MWVKVRSMDGSKSVQVDNLSKLTKIEELRLRLADVFDAVPERQRLFYGGKQLEDGHTLFDYSVGLNDIIQIMIRSKVQNDCVPRDEDDATNVLLAPSASNCKSVSSMSNKENEEVNEENRNCKSDSVTSDYFQIGDFVDVKDKELGAWFAGKIVRIKRSSKSHTNNLKECDKNIESSNELELDEKEVPPVKVGRDNQCERVADDGLLYEVVFERFEDESPEECTINEIRPRARTKLSFAELVVGDVVMANYNIEEPKKRGYWYDCKVLSKKTLATGCHQLFVTVYFGSQNEPLDNCIILYADEVFQIEKVSVLSTREQDSTSSIIPSRSVKPRCDHCKDIFTRKCKHCSCHICGGKNDPDKQVLCDECDMAYHLWCLNPPLEQVPEEEEEWFCPLCKNDTTEVVQAGQKLKDSKKKAKMASATGNTARDWGKGMACVGRTKVCTIVPSNHWGPVPGVEVGMMWKFRVQVSETGVHRPHVAGMHGRDGEGAFSIVLSGGYEDDVDKGDEFMYTGSGGRDLSGNKRTAQQSCNQTLTRTNRCLALNCASPLNDKSGAEAKNWRDGKPVRVVRNSKGAKHSKFCPQEGNRYDGIYKVVKYWPEKGKSGYLVWRYLLRRDDNTPAPWTLVGKKRIEELGYVMQYPDGYLEAKKEEQEHAKKAEKRSQIEDSSSSRAKKLKCPKYRIPPEMAKLIANDNMNRKLWAQCKLYCSDGQQRFLKEVEEVFGCVCCQELVYQPVTTNCQHNICKSCLQRSFKAEVYCCPTCRSNLGKDASTAVNSNLAEVLMKLFPGYDFGR